MLARYKDPENLEEITQEILPDFYTCPIMRQIMRYPVVAADGHRYEAMALFRYVVEQGNETSPLRTGGGTVLPVVYDAHWKELLDQLFPQHSERCEDYIEDSDYSVKEMVDQINNKFLPLRTRDEALHVQIGNRVLVISPFYLFFNMVLVFASSHVLFGPRQINEGLLILIALTATLGMLIKETQLRIESDNRNSIVGSIADRYYSLFKRPQPPRFPHAHQPQDPVPGLNQ